MKKLMIGLVAAVAMVGCCTQPCNGIKDSGTTYVADALAPYVESGELPGAVCMLYKDGVTETACVGYADVAKKRKITADDVYMQCSQTKGFCGVTIAKLVEEGKLNLDDPVSKYLPEFATLWVNGGETNGVKTLVKAKNVLTVRMCLNHTGGFPFEICAKSPAIKGGGWSGGAPLRQTAAIAAASPLLFEPGTKVQYSNTGIDIGAAVVEVVTGMKWEDYLKKEVLDPLGMSSSWFWPTDEQLKTHDVASPERSAAASLQRRPRVCVRWRWSLDDGARPVQVLQDAYESWRWRQWSAHPQGRDGQVDSRRLHASEGAWRLFSRAFRSRDRQRGSVVRTRRRMGHELLRQLAQEAAQALGRPALRWPASVG